jgi:UDP-glucose 4-epimerase
MKTVVFGGSGFLGSHVADALTAAGHEVVIFDRVSSRFLKDGQKMIVGDLFNVNDLEEALRGSGAVFHFAGIAGIKDANDRPLDAVKNNVLGTVNVLEACRRQKVRRFVFASSIYVYSEEGGVYRSTKQACELLIENYQKLYGIHFTILRFGSLYGSRANHFNFIHAVIRQALMEGKMERRGAGEEIRDYIHVLDAAKACVTALQDDYEDDYLMITGSQSIKVKDLMSMIREKLNNRVELKFLAPDNEDDHYKISPYTFRPRMAHKLTQQTQIDLSQGIRDTIDEVYREIKAESGARPAIQLPE